MLCPKLWVFSVCCEKKTIPLPATARNSLPQEMGTSKNSLMDQPFCDKHFTEKHCRGKPVFYFHSLIHVFVCMKTFIQCCKNIGLGLIRYYSCPLLDQRFNPHENPYIARCITPVCINAFFCLAGFLYQFVTADLWGIGQSR